MTTEALLRKLHQTERRLAAVERQLGNIPVRWPRPGSGTLPDGTERYKVLMIIDDLEPGTWGVDWPRVH